MTSVDFWRTEGKRYVDVGIDLKGQLLNLCLWPESEQCVLQWIVRLFLCAWKGNSRWLGTHMVLLRTNPYRKCPSFPSMDGLLDDCLGKFWHVMFLNLREAGDVISYDMWTKYIMVAWIIMKLNEFTDELKKKTKKLIIEPRRLSVIALHGRLQIVFLKVLVWSKRHTLLILSWNSEEFPVYFFWPINKIQFRLQKTWNPKSSKFYRKTTGASQAACHWLTHSCQMLSQKLPWRLQNLLQCGLTQGIIFILKTRTRQRGKQMTTF